MMAWVCRKVLLVLHKKHTVQVTAGDSKAAMTAPEQGGKSCVLHTFKIEKI